MVAVRAVLAALLVSSLVAHLGPARAYACSCYVPESEPEIRRTVDGARMILEGTVTDTSADPRTMTVDVERVYKGSPGDEVTFNITRDGAGCGYEVAAPGERHFLLVYEIDGELQPTLCGSFPLGAGSSYEGGFYETIARIAPGEGGGRDGGGGSGWLIGLGAAAIAVALLGGAVMFFRRQAGAAA